MNTVFTEDIENIKTVDEEGMANSIRTVKYVLVCHHRGIENVNMFEVTLPEPSHSDFLNYESLKKDLVLGWVRAAIGEESLTARKAAMVAFIDQTIAAQQALFGAEKIPQIKQAPWN